jgi:hypothetical protein
MMVAQHSRHMVWGTLTKIGRRRVRRQAHPSSAAA